MTLSYGSLRAARDVWALVTGAGKAEVLASVIAGEGDLPMSKVIRDRNRRVRFIVDSAAARFVKG